MFLFGLEHDISYQLTQKTGSYLQPWSTGSHTSMLTTAREVSSREDMWGGTAGLAGGRGEAGGRGGAKAGDGAGEGQEVVEGPGQGMEQGRGRRSWRGQGRGWSRGGAGSLGGARAGDGILVVDLENGKPGISLTFEST